jgi:hypothetical protein
LLFEEMKKRQLISIITLATLLDINKQSDSEKGRISRLDAAMVWDEILAGSERNKCQRPIALS